MSDEPSSSFPNPDETVVRLKVQLIRLRQWFERERWKIEPRSFARHEDDQDDGPEPV